jgi:DNA-binding transcriptional ArsR family regulator
VAIFEVLAEPNRRVILDLLRVEERAVGNLVSALGISQPAVSKHLKVLRDAGAVEARIVAQQRIYNVKPEALIEIDEWLAPYRRMWAQSLELLERHLEEMDRPKRAKPKGKGRG